MLALSKGLILLATSFALALYTRHFDIKKIKTTTNKRVSFDFVGFAGLLAATELLIVLTFLGELPNYTEFKNLLLGYTVATICSTLTLLFNFDSIQIINSRIHNRPIDRPRLKLVAIEMLGILATATLGILLR